MPSDGRHHAREVRNAQGCLRPEGRQVPVVNMEPKVMFGVAIIQFSRIGFDRSLEGGIDTNETETVLLEHGQWSTARAAEPYASADEQTAQAMGFCAIEFSDEEG